MQARMCALRVCLPLANRMPCTPLPCLACCNPALQDTTPQTTLVRSLLLKASSPSSQRRARTSPQPGTVSSQSTTSQPPPRQQQKPHRQPPPPPPPQPLPQTRRSRSPLRLKRRRSNWRTLLLTMTTSRPRGHKSTRRTRTYAARLTLQQRLLSTHTHTRTHPTDHKHKHRGTHRLVRLCQRKGHNAADIAFECAPVVDHPPPFCPFGTQRTALIFNIKYPARRTNIQQWDCSCKRSAGGVHQLASTCTFDTCFVLGYRSAVVWWQLGCCCI